MTFSSHKFIIIDIHRESLLDLLLDVVVYDGVRLARSGCAEHHCGAKRIDDVDPSGLPFLPIIEARREVDRVFVRHQAGLLHEAFVLHIEDVVHEVVLQQATRPRPGHEQADEAGGEGREIQPGARVRPDRQAERPAVQEEQQGARGGDSPDTRPGDPLRSDALRAEAGE